MEDTIISIDSKYRDLSKYPNESSFTINLDKIYKNIVSVKLVSLELTNSLNFASTMKGNNYFTLYLPNKLNDPDGIKINVDLPQQQDINNIIYSININIENNIQENNNYSNIFYISQISMLNINSIINNKSISLTLRIGWYSIDGLILIIFDCVKKNYGILNDENFNIFHSNLHIFNKNYQLHFYNTYNINYNSSLINDILSIIKFDNYNLTDSYNIKMSLDSCTQRIQIINDKINGNYIAEFEIDFSTTNNTNNIQNIKYLSLGYYLGYRLINNSFLLTPKLINNKLILLSTKNYNILGEDYIFLKINDWGNIDFFNKILFSKFYLRSDLTTQNKTNNFINKEYIFRQLSNISKIDVELIDYLGNTVDLNGVDFSFSISLRTQTNIGLKQINDLQNQGYY